MIAGLLLAAGRSSRFGSDKLCASIRGEAVIRSSFGALAELDEVLVIVPPDDAAIRNALAGTPSRFVSNAQRDSGMASSIRAGVQAAPVEADAVVIALADQPYARADVTRMLVQRWSAGGADIVAPQYTDGRGHPVLFARRCFDALAQLEGDDGARGLMSDGRFSFATVSMPFAMPLDVDTPELLALAAERATHDASISPPSA